VRVLAASLWEEQPARQDLGQGPAAHAHGYPGRPRQEEVKVAAVGEMERVLSGTLLGDAERLLIVDAIDVNQASALVGDAERVLGRCLLGDADCLVVAIEAAVGEMDRVLSGTLLGDTDRLLIVDAIELNHVSAMGLLGFESSVSNHPSASHSAPRVLAA